MSREQEVHDLRQLLECLDVVCSLSREVEAYFQQASTRERIEGRLGTAIQALQDRVIRHLEEERFLDAERLQQQLLHDFGLPSGEVLLNHGFVEVQALSRLHEKMGHFWAAIILQEKAVGHFLSRNFCRCVHQKAVIRALDGLYNCFVDRVVGMDPEWFILAKLSVLQRSLAINVTDGFNETATASLTRMIEVATPIDPELLKPPTLYKLAFHLAAKYNAVDFADTMCEKYAKEEFNLPECPNEAGRTALHTAAIHGNNGFVDMLVSDDADLEAKDGDGSTPLHLVALHNIDVGTMSFLIHLGADVNATNNEGMSVLHCVISGSHFNELAMLERVPLLLYRGANIEAKDCRGCTSLHRIAALCEGRILRMMLKHIKMQGKGYIIHWKNTNGDTPLSAAIRLGGLSMQYSVSLLLDSGADVHARNKDGETYLYQVLDSHPNILGARLTEVLIDHHIDVDAQNNLGLTVLHRATQCGQVKQMSTLLEYGRANVCSKTEMGRTALHLAVEICGEDKKMTTKGAIKKLLNHKANVDHQDAQGNTPLHLAVRRENKTAVRALISAGARDDIENHEGVAPISLVWGLGLEGSLDSESMDSDSMDSDSMDSNSVDSE